MSKPIFLVGFSDQIPMDEVNDMEEILSEKHEDYHVLIYTSNSIKTPVFEAFLRERF